MRTITRSPFGVLLCSTLFLLGLSPAAPAASGSGTFRLSHLSLDEEGSNAASYRTFNLYEGTALSLENFSYDFGGGIRARLEGRNMTLNNRWIEAGLRKPGSFGVTLSTTQNRRIYSADGTEFIRRHASGAHAHLFVVPAIRVDVGASLQGRSGTPEPLFSLTDIPLLQPVDLDQRTGQIGVRYSDHGRTLGIEAKQVEFDDKLDDRQDQTRQQYRIDAMLPVPRLEQITLSGGYRYFTSERDFADTAFTSHTVWVGGSARATDHWSVRYAFVFDRAGNQSDPVETDNLTNAVYVTYARARQLIATAGYQHGITDDFGRDVRTSGFYGSLTLRSGKRFEFKANAGTRAEELNEGSRLLGDEDWNRYRGSLKYTFADGSYCRLTGESQTRENSLIGTSVDAIRGGAELSLALRGWTVSGTASYSEGEFTNSDGMFSYIDRSISADLQLPRWHGIQLSGRTVYYRASGELYIESFHNSVGLDVRLDRLYSLRGSYSADVFDDFDLINQFSTTNIVEVSIARELSF